MNDARLLRQPERGEERQLEAAVQRVLEGYYEADAPWDTGVSPPELVAVVEGPGAPTPGRVLELGCGTGTNAIYLARHGWDVVAVDLVDRAVRLAGEKAAAADVAVRFLRGDVTQLDDLDAPGPFDLFFDLSCYCGIPPHRRDAFAAGLSERAAPGARLLMFGYGPGAFDDTWSGVTADELRTRFAGWDLLDATPGTNDVPTWWFTLRRSTGPIVSA